jgi:hypothetical protein
MGDMEGHQNKSAGDDCTQKRTDVLEKRWKKHMRKVMKRFD